MASKRQAKGSGGGVAKRGRKATAGPSRSAEGRGEGSPNVLERGDVFFFYRPDVGEESPGSLLDVRRFHVVLRPEDGKVLRLITIGRKKLPGPEDGDRSFWGFVERVFADAEGLREVLGPGSYETQTRGRRELPAARPVGEGVYALARAGRSSVFAYALELPEAPGEVQEAFNLAPEGRFVLSIKNPEAGAPEGLGLDGDRRAEFPDELKELFGDRKWVAADPPAFLDHEGAELVLIAGRDEATSTAGEDLGLEPQPEDVDSAEVFRDLKLEKTDRAVRPLFEGAWS